MPVQSRSLKELFLAALGVAPAERGAWLERECGQDVELRQRVELMLAAHDTPQSLLDRLAPAAAPPEAGTGAFAAAGAERPSGAEREAVGTVVAGRYKLVEEIGEGGMGTVWMAQQTEPVRRLVALKVIKPGMDSKQVLARFEAERQALALMEHANIARVLDGGSTATGRPYFVMELVKGVPLTRYCDEHRLTPRQRLELFVPVCQAVQHAHQKGVIHRDLKPSNVLVALYDGKPVPKVIDFGIAKATGQQLTDKTLVTGFGSVVGTLEYMSPEQAELNQLDIDTRSDIYSLGVLLYELLTGSTPLEGKRLKQAAMLEVLRIIREEEPPRPSARLSSTDALPAVAANRGLEPRKLSGLVRGELDWIVMKALEKDRSRRYETANGFAMDVQRYLADEPVQACPPSAWYRFRKIARRNRSRLAVAAGMFLAVTVIAVTIGWAVRDRSARAEESERAEAVRLEQVERQVRESWQAARTLLAENKVSAARQKLAEARTQLGNDRAVLTDLAAEIEAGAAELDRWQQFLDLIERAHEAETALVLEAALAADGSHGGAGTPRPPSSKGWRPAAAVPFLVQALDRYDILERDDWPTTLEWRLLGPEQVEHLRRTAYEELLWLAHDVGVRQQDHRSGGQLSREAALRQTLVYLGKAASAHRPTQALYALRAQCRRALGDKALAQADTQLAAKTPPAMALDHYLRGQDLYMARKLADGVAAFEAALRLEPTHYWSLMWLGYCWCYCGQRPEDFTVAAGVFTGCILKRPGHARAYVCRGNAYSELGQLDKAVADYSRAIELDPKDALPWFDRGNAYAGLEQYDKAVTDYSQAIALEPKYVPAWNNRGKAYSKLGQPDKAISDYSRAIALYPKHAFPWYNRGQEYSKLGQPDKAIADFSQAIKLAPKAALPWYNRGNAYYKLSQHDKAVADYDTAIQLDPKLAQAWMNRGILYCHHLGRPDKAVVDFSRAIELRPKDALIWSNRGEAYSELGQLDKAVADFSQAIKLDPKDTSAWINRGNAYCKLSQHDKAIGDYSRAIKRDPKLAGAWHNRAIAYHELRQYDKAVADDSEAIKLDPKLAGAWHNRGVAYRNLRQYEKAVADDSEAIKLDPKMAKAWNNRGIAYYHLGQYDKAVADFSQGIALDPKDAGTWNNRGNAYRKLGQHDKAIDDYSQAIALDPKDAPTWNNRGNAYSKLGQHDKAIGDYSQAIKLDPKDAKAWNNRGIAYYHLGQSDKAVADYSQAIALDPKDAGTWNNRGNAYCKLGQHDKAIGDYSQAIKLDPNVALYWNNRGFAYRKLGQHGKAVADLSQAIKLDPKYALAWYNRGNTYRELRQYDKAVADFSRAIELDPKYASSWSERGILYCYHLGQPEKAVADFSQAIELEPNNASYWSNRGTAYSKLGQYDKAVADFSHAIQLAPNSVHAWNGRGMAYYSLHQYDKALADFQRVMTIAPPWHAGAHNSLAWLLATCPDARLRDPKRAVELARRAVQLAPNDGHNWGTLGTAHYRAGAWKEAVVALDKSLELKPGWDAHAWLFLAMAHRKLGHDGEAHKAFDRAIEWLERNQELLAKDKAQAEELRRFRSEAEAVLELKKP
jgi:tetratricopeptide (TPR) repeat protein